MSHPWTRREVCLAVGRLLMGDRLIWVDCLLLSTSQRRIKHRNKHYANDPFGGKMLQEKTSQLFDDWVLGYTSLTKNYTLSSVSLLCALRAKTLNIMNHNANVISMRGKQISEKSLNAPAWNTTDPPIPSDDSLILTSPLWKKAFWGRSQLA